MDTSSRSEHNLFRILLYQNEAAEVLMETTGHGLRTPALAIPRHSRIAEEITAAIETRWNLTAYCLFSLPSDGCSRDLARYQVAEVSQPERPPAGMHWFPADSLSAGQFAEPSDFAAIQESLTTLNRYGLGQLPGFFGKSGWLRPVTEWVAACATTSGLRLTGKFHQFNATPTFSLLRFETDGPALWFKAVGEPNLHEHRITLKLFSIFPAFLPSILASRPEWNAWLALDSGGSPLDADSTALAWATTATNLASLQISSLGRRFELINAGCKDLRPCALADLVDSFLNTMTELMEQQTKLSPARLSRHDLHSLGDDITSALQELGEYAIPNALGHLDMNPGNLMVSGKRCIFLDWAEAYVGPPFFSFQYLREHLRRLHGADSRHERSLLSSYVRHWTRFASPSEIATTFRLIPLLAAFAYAGRASWRNPEAIRPETAARLRSLTRRMKREADAIRQSRPTCVP